MIIRLAFLLFDGKSISQACPHRYPVFVPVEISDIPNSFSDVHKRTIQFKLSSFDFAPYLMK